MPVIPRSTGAGHGFFLSNTTLFNIFASLGVFSIAAALGPALFSSRVKRPRIWFGLLTAWLVYSVSYLLLLGRQLGPANPPFGLCFFQASLIYATSPLCAVATTCFAIDFFLKLSMLQIKGKPIGRKITVTLFISPWILGLVTVAEAILSVQDSSTVVPDLNHFYCHITGQIPSYTNIAIIFTCGVILTPLGIYTAIHLHRNWTVFKRFSKQRAHIALSTFLRLTLFSMIVSLAMGLSVFTATGEGNDKAAFSLILTTLPTFAALCLGTQRDILETWMFWKKGGSPPPTLIQHPKQIPKPPSIVIEIPSPVLGLWKPGPAAG